MAKVPSYKEINDVIKKIADIPSKVDDEGFILADGVSLTKNTYDLKNGNYELHVMDKKNDKWKSFDSEDGAGCVERAAKCFVDFYNAKHKSESRKFSCSMQKKKESVQKKKESVLEGSYPVITSDDKLRYALLATSRIRKNDMVRIIPCIEVQGQLWQVYTGRVNDPVWYRAGRIVDHVDLHNDKAFVAVVDTPQEALQEFRKLGNPEATRVALQSENRVYWDDVSDEGTIKVKNTAPFRNNYYDVDVPDNGTHINDGISGSMGGDNWEATVYWKPKDAVTAAFKWLDDLMEQARDKGDSLMTQQSDRRSRGSAMKSRITAFQNDED